jgi:hypothetical protein
MAVFLCRREWNRARGQRDVRSEPAIIPAVGRGGAQRPNVVLPIKFPTNFKFSVYTKITVYYNRNNE